MRRCIGLVAALLGTACVSTPSASPKAGDAAAGRQTLRYEVEGVRVIQVIDTSLPTTQMVWRFAAGADAEGANEVASCDLLAALMSRGADGKTAMQMAAAIDRIGGSLGGSASRDSIRFTASGLSRYSDTLARLLAATVRHPNLAKEELERLRREVLAGLKSSRNRGRNLAAKALLRSLYGDDRLGLPVGGNEAAVTGRTLAQLKTLYGRIIHPGNLTVGVFGATGVAATRKLLETHLGAWKRGQKPASPPPAKVAAKTRLHIVDKPDLTQVDIHFGGAGVRRKRSDYDAIVLLNYALGGGGFSSRLMKLIRSKHGLTYGIRSSFSAGERAGPFRITSFTRVEKVRQLIDLTLQVVDEVASDGISAAELARAKGYYLGSFPLRLETVEGEGALLLFADRYDLGDDFIAGYSKRIEAVTLASVNALAKKLLRSGELAIVLAGPKEKLLDAVKGLGSVSASWWEDDKPLKISD